MNEPTHIISTIRLTEKASLLGERHNQSGDRAAFGQEGNPGKHLSIRRQKEARTPG